MKNKKLNLKELKVKSFVTSMENDTPDTVKGGGKVPYTIGTCWTRDPQDCPPRDTNQTQCMECDTNQDVCTPSVVICMSNGAGGVGANC